jgi:hypothetical protein
MIARHGIRHHASKFTADIDFTIVKPGILRYFADKCSGAVFSLRDRTTQTAGWHLRSVATPLRRIVPQG